MKKVVLTSALLLCISSIQAAESIRWDSASLSYQSMDSDGNEFTGFEISGTTLVSENFFVAGSYSSVSADIEVVDSKVDIDLNTLSVGIGYRHGISSHTDIFGILSYEYLEIETLFRGQSADDNENAYVLEAGIRSLVTEHIELSGSISYIGIDDESETSFNLSAMYHFTDQFSAGAGYGKPDSDDVDFLSLSAVYFF